MLAVVAILLIFGLVVRHKWKNANAKKEEILRMLAVTSEEEAVIAKLQAVEVYSPPLPPPPPLEKYFYCPVCYSHATTRCSQCKAVRYCSGKCQIIHWRHGHKEECQPASVLYNNNDIDASKMCSEPEFETYLGARTFFYPTDKRDSGSSSNSLARFSSSTDLSETSFDVSLSESLESGTPEQPGKAPSVVFDSHAKKITLESVEADLQISSSLEDSSTTQCGPKKIKSSQAPKHDEGVESVAFKEKIDSDEAAKFEDLRAGKTDEFKVRQPSSSVRISGTEDQRNQAAPCTGKEMRSTSIRGSGNHQTSHVESKGSQLSKPLKTPPSDDYWSSVAQLSNETRSMSLRTSGNYQNVAVKNESYSSPPSEVESGRISQPTNRGVKTSLWKFAQHFRSPKQSKSAIRDIGKDSSENHNNKDIFKLFVRLYSCDDVVVRPFGLANCGNSCYANAVLQCLTFTRPITSYLLQGLHKKTCCKRDWCFTCELESLMRKGQEVRYPLSPTKIVSKIPAIGSYLNSGTEEDAHEFLRNVVDNMQTTCLEESGASGSLAEDSTLIGLTFGGYLQSKIKCMKCLGRSAQSERMMDLTVEIDGYVNTLEEALAQFTKSELLAGEDKYKCNRCKSYEKAKKRLTILEAPNILTIGLKRFQSGSSEKLNKLVLFPEFLNLGPYMGGKKDENPFYHLYAVVVHLDLMNAADTGHYISYVKDFKGNWFRIDDDRVIAVDLEIVLSEEAYILFYARQTPRVGSLTRNNNKSEQPEVKTRKISKSKKPSRSTESTMLSSKHQSWTPPDDFHVMKPSQNLGFQSKYSNPILDSPSECSSIFSFQMLAHIVQIAERTQMLRIMQVMFSDLIAGTNNNY